MIVFVVLAALMQSLDTTIANVALPYMRGSLAASQDEIDWVLTSYIVAAAVMMPAAGFFATRFGRTRVFVSGVIGFTVASVFCGLAQTIGQMVVARLLQGVFGAVLIPMAQTVLIDSYPAEQRGRGMALFGAGVMLGPILGPTVGGWLTSALSWRWVFYVNVPIGIAAAIGLATTLVETKRLPVRFDWTGFLMLALAVGAFQAMLDRGQQQDWFGAREIVLEALCALAGLYCFVIHTRFAHQPFLSPALLRDRNFVTGVGCAFVAGLGMYATIALISPFLQNLLDYPVLAAGITMAPNGIGTILGMFVSGRLLAVVSARWMLLLGFAGVAATLFVLGDFTADVSRTAVMEVLFVQGASLGLSFVALSTVTFATLPAALRAQGTGVYSLVRNLGSSIGISVAATMLERNQQVSHASIAAAVTPFNRMLQTGAAGRLWNPLHGGAAALDAVINQQAAGIAYADDFRLLTGVTLLALPIAMLIRVSRQSAPETVME